MFLPFILLLTNNTKSKKILKSILGNALNFGEISRNKRISVSFWSSLPETFFKKGVLRNFWKFTGNTYTWVSFLIKLQQWRRSPHPLKRSHCSVHPKLEENAPLRSWLSSTFDNGRVQGTNGTSCTGYAQIQQHIYFEGPWKYDQLVSIVLNRFEIIAPIWNTCPDLK